MVSTAPPAISVPSVHHCRLSTPMRIATPVTTPNTVMKLKKKISASLNYRLDRAKSSTHRYADHPSIKYPKSVYTTIPSCVFILPTTELHRPSVIFPWLPMIM